MNSSEAWQLNEVLCYYMLRSSHSVSVNSVWMRPERKMEAKSFSQPTFWEKNSN